MFSYETLEVYKKAYRANQCIYRLLTENKTIPNYVRNQLGRASLSIMLNIAEGSGKFTETYDPECWATFLRRLKQSEV